MKIPKTPKSRQVLRAIDRRATKDERITNAEFARRKMGLINSPRSAQ